MTVRNDGGGGPQAGLLAPFKRALRAPLVMRAAWRDRRLGAAAHPLALVAIMRNEAPFLEEWLRFHLAAGVAHAYLYDNGSTDGTRDVLAPWVAAGRVTLIPWPGAVAQLPAYRHAVRHFAGAARWMAFIDVDEFLFAPDGGDLPTVLRDYADLPGVVVHAPYFGAAGHACRPPPPIGRAFTRRAPLTTVSAKTIANPRRIRQMRNVHLFKYVAGEALDTARRRPGAGPVVLDRLRLNHYWSRSLADLRDKVARGDASTAARRDPAWHEAFERTLNAEEDTSIVPLLDRVFGPP